MYLVLLFTLVVTKSLCLEVDPKTSSNITVIGTVFCDACCNNNFTSHSYYLQGVKVRVTCDFRVNSTSKEEISITADRTTDKFGVYKIDIPPVDGFECKQGRELQSLCRSLLIESPSLLCDVPGLSSSTEHIALKANDPNLCLYNLNALNYRPSKRDNNSCRSAAAPSSALNASLFLWPPFPPFWWTWGIWPPLPFPFPTPPSLPFPFPPIPYLTPPPAFPFPFLTPPPPAFPFPIPPVFPTPSPPTFPPLPQLPPIPFFTPPPPPPSLPFPLPPLLPPLTPFPFPPLVIPPPPPPPPPPPSFPVPLPPIPFLPIPSPPPPPSSAFSWRDPRTWFPDHPPSSPNQP